MKVFDAPPIPDNLDPMAHGMLCEECNQPRCSFVLLGEDEGSPRPTGSRVCLPCLNEATAVLEGWMNGEPWAAEAWTMRDRYREKP